ncbi:aldose 1-epimerase family protein [Clostridium oceanicum]|uniref:Aldose 1-epimerase family protein n=1 Tax=Clostridium oceanicum TaxID=1543 RepID=A0ABN1JHT8_9CLOT
MIETIKNDLISISVKSHGAEICSFKSLENDKEYLWQGDPKYWGKHAPILFPFVGASKNGKYTYKGEEYRMSKHGFARDSEFELVEKSDGKLKYLLKSNEDTMKKYPFIFELYVIYEIKGKILDITYKVNNKDSKEMYFSIGGHPAFNCDIREGDKYLEFEDKVNLETYMADLKTGIIVDKKKKIIENQKELLLKYDLFYDDALIFDSSNLDSIFIKDGKTEEKIKITIKGFPYLGIWTKHSPKSPYLCIEPWYGIPDLEKSKGKIEDKKGIEKLNIGETFSCSYKVEVI